MSLAEAVLDVAVMLETEAATIEADKTYSAPMFKFLVQSTARQLRLLVKAAEVTAALQPPAPITIPNHQQALDQARAEVRADRQKQLEAGNMVQIMDGPMKGDYLPMPSNITVGMKTALNGFVYQLRADGQLWLFQEQEVKKD